MLFRSASGATYLVPFDGNKNPVSKLYPLKELQAAIQKLKPRLGLLIFDGSVSRSGAARTKSKNPEWHLEGGTLVELVGTAGIQDGIEIDKVGHGLFTYQLLRGLRGEADGDRDGTVTFGELADWLGQTVPTVSKKEFGREQRPWIYPGRETAGRVAGIALARSARGVASR